MNDPDIQSSMPTIVDQEKFAAAMLTVCGFADRPMVCRTQRRVREQAIEMAERNRRMRHGIGLTILAFSLLLLVLTPVIWGGVRMQLEQGWQGFGDFDIQSTYMIGWLFPITIIGLVLGCIRMRAGRGARRIDHRVASRLDSLVR